MTDVPPGQPPFGGQPPYGRGPGGQPPDAPGYGGPGSGGRPPGPPPAGGPHGGQDPRYVIGSDGQVRSQPPRPPSSGNRTVIVVTIIALLVLAGGVIAAILVLTNDDGKGSSPSTTPMSSAPRTSPTPTPTPTQRTRPTSSAPTTSAPTTSAAPQTPSGGPSGAESAVANALPATATAAGNLYFRALAGHDLAALRRIACPSTTITLSQPTLDRVTSAEPTGPARATGAAATMTGRITGNDRSTATISAHLAAYGAGWCLAGTQVG